MGVGVGAGGGEEVWAAGAHSTSTSASARRRQPALRTLENWVRRLLGSREVVISSLGSTSPACAYSSSMCVRTTAVLSSSSSTSARSCASSCRSSEGMGLPSAQGRRRRRRVGGRAGGRCVEAPRGGGLGRAALGLACWAWRRARRRAPRAAAARLRRPSRRPAIPSARRRPTFEGLLD
jgi:hypothetical protein